jgi:hypothetical protein
VTVRWCGGSPEERTFQIEKLPKTGQSGMAAPCGNAAAGTLAAPPSRSKKAIGDLRRSVGSVNSTERTPLGSSFGTTFVGNSVGVAYKFDLTSLVQRVVKGGSGSRYTRVALR